MAAKKNTEPEDVVYRQRYEQVDASNVRPDAARQRRRQEELDRIEANKAGVDPSQPEGGPYGPNADYAQVTAPNDADHTSPAQPVKE